MDSEIAPEPSMIGRRVGVYRLEEEVGRGGMGVVYRARRDDGEFDQTVAIKLIKRGMDTDAILRRFRRERQITAALNHPNIAYFFGGGSTEDGLPFFVMEYISGLPLYDYCDKGRLTIRERLQIFRQVCWAVQAAHDIKVIHRDLKPSNVMVTDAGKPKLLDFGIAKVLDPDLGGTDHEPTATQLRVMTPEYASPEQISGGEILPASDIYSLGVMLYELLTGHRPYSFSRIAPQDAARVIRETMPTNPSVAVTGSNDLVPVAGEKGSLEGVLFARDSTAESLKRELAGPLDRIVLKAMRKDRSDRYRTAAEFADDISNFLEHRPVMADFYSTLSNAPRPQPEKLSLAILPFRVLGRTGTGETGEEFLGIGLTDTLISRLGRVPRLVLRPTTSVIGFAEAVPFIAARELGVDFVIDGTVRIVSGRIRLSIQIYSAKEDTTRWARSFDTPVRDIIELEETLAEQVAAFLMPRLTSEERSRIERRGTCNPAAYEAYLRGRYFWSRFTDQGLRDALREFERAIELDPQFALPYVGIADHFIWSAIFGEVPTREAFSRAEEAARKALSIDDSMAEAYAVLASCVLLHHKDWKEAEMIARRAIELNPNHPFAHECLSNAMTSQGKFDEGIREIRLAEELDPVSPRSILMTSWTLYQAGRFEDAVAAAEKANAMQPDLPQGLLHLGNALIETGRYDEAVVALRRSAELWGEAGLPRYMLAFARAAQGNTEAVGTILKKLLDTEKRRFVKPYFIAMCFVAAGRPDEAFEWFKKSEEDDDEWLAWWATEPKLRSLHSDPRYRELLEATGNPIAGADNSAPITGERDRSIAVLPFKLIGDQPGLENREYLSLGLAEAVTMRLSNVRKFVVRPTSSVLKFAQQPTDSFNAGRQLGVEFIVEGLIRPIGNKIRVTVQLLNVAEGSVRWAASYLEKPGDILELEDSISDQIGRSLIPHLTGDDRRQLEKRGTRNAAAYDAYLQGRYFWSRFLHDSFSKSRESFQKAVDLDPEFALAYVGLADFYSWGTIYGIMPSSEAVPRVKELAEQALSIDPNLAEAHAALGLYFSNMRAWDRAEAQYRKAIDINPNYPLSHEWLSSVLVGTGRIEEGVTELVEAERLDPLSLRPKVLSAWTLYQTRDFESAEKKARELLELAPDFMQSHLQLANILLETGEVGAALEHALRASELEAHSTIPLYAVCFAYARSGKSSEAVETITRWEKQAPYVPPYFLGLSYLAVGDRRPGYTYLRQALDENSPWALWLSSEPKLDPFRDEPEYLEIVRMAGLPPHTTP